MASRKRKQAASSPAAGAEVEDLEIDRVESTGVERTARADAEDLDGIDALDAVAEDADGAEEDPLDAEADGAYDGFSDTVGGARGAEPSARRRRASERTPARSRSGEPARTGRRASESAAAGARRPAPAEAKDSTATATARERKAAEAEQARSGRRRVRAAAPNPAWLAPTAVTLLILGLVYLVIYYITAGQLPLPIDDWNLAVGFGLLVVGGGLLMRWK